MTNTKRNYILGLLLVVIVALATFFCVMSMETTQKASAESATSGLEYTLSDDKTYYSVTGYSGSSTSVVIPSTYNGLPVTKIGQSAFENNTSIISVSIPSSITLIGYSCFSNCKGLTSIYFNAASCRVQTKNSVTSNAYSSSWDYNIAFQNAGANSSGITLTIGASVTKIPVTLFAPYANRTGSSKEFGYKDSYTNTEDCSKYAPNIVSVVFEKGCVCETIGEAAFMGCTSIKSVTIGDSVTTIDGYAFYKCTSLTSLTIGSNVDTIGYKTFAYCSSLTSVTMSDSVTTLGMQAFAYCSSLTSINLRNVTSIGGNAFTSCSKLASVTIPSSVTYIGYCAFYSCSSLTSVTIVNKSVWYVTKTSGAESGTDLSSTDLSDTATTATYLTDTYVKYYWYYTDKDTVAPTISGASTSETGYYTNGSFTVTAEDDGSGVAYLYYKIPTASAYSSTTSTTKTYSSGVVNGLYCFYAEDNEGNVSETYYVYYDNTAPTLSVSGATFGSATGTSFTVTASDVGGSDTTLYYRKGSSGNFTKASSSSYTVSSTAGDDNYYFYAVDAAINTSSTYVVTLSTTTINGSFVKSDTDNTVFFYWTNSLWTATLDGSSYTSGTWITEEGTHTVILTSPTTGSKTYSYNIEHNYVAIQTVAPTCSAEGYTIYECTQCGDTYKADYTEKLAHTYATTTTAATCTEQGYITYTCKVCGYSYKSDYVEAVGHDFEMEVVEPTCSEQGYTIYTCNVCGYTYNDDYTDTIPHSYQSVYVAPTCTEGGYIEYTCVNCGDNYTVEISLPTEHSFTITVIRSATCTETGLRHYCCDNCGYEYDVEIPALGHNYVIINVENDDGNTIRTYQCDECGDTYVEDLGNQAEYVASYVEYLFELYSDYIWWLLLATVGVWSIVMGVFFAVATKNEDKQKARKMVVNYLIGLVAIAVILVAAPLLAYGIAVLVT